MLGLLMGVEWLQGGVFPQGIWEQRLVEAPLVPQQQQLLLLQLPTPLLK